MSKIEYTQSKTYFYNERNHIHEGNSSVFFATDGNLGRDVCIKVLRNVINSSQEREIKREVALLCTLADRITSIPRIYDYYYDKKNSCAYIVMEKIIGDRFDRVNCSTEVRLCQFMEQLTGVLIEMGKKKFNHLDLKPENMIIRNKKELVLFDFNLSAHISNYVRGSFGYKAPEMAGIVKTPSRKKSDMFSIGVIMYEKLTGVLPTYRYDYYYDNPFKHHGSWDYFKEPIEYRNISQKVNDIIVRCMKAEPEDRYKNLYALRNDLKEARRR